MASLGHVLFGIALSRAQEGGARRHRVLGWLAYPVLAMAPDLDVAAFAFGIPYESQFGHRGASHAISTCLVLGALAGAGVARLVCGRLATGAVLGAAAMVSHGLFDTMTTGGEGVALLWPFTDARFFAPLRPIPVAPIGPAFLSMRGLYCMGVELVLFAPFLLYSVLRRRRPATGGQGPL